MAPPALQTLLQVLQHAAELRMLAAASFCWQSTTAALCHERAWPDTRGLLHQSRGMLADVQEENEEMGRDLGEGRVHALERQLALARSFAEDMRRAFQELEDHCDLLDEECERLQDEVCGPGQFAAREVHCW